MIPDSTQDAKKPIRSSVLVKARATRSRDERGKKRKKPDNKKQSNKKQKEAKSVKKDEDDCPSDSSQMNLSIELKPIGGYLNDRLLMLEQMFHSLKEKKIRAMLPEILKDMAIDELKRLCVEQLEVMSKKRIRRILAGADPEEISSSGTEDEDEEEVEEEQESIQPADSTSIALEGDLLPDQVELNADANEVDSLYDDNLDNLGKPKGKNAIRRADEEAKKRMQASALKRKHDPARLVSGDNDIYEKVNDGNNVKEQVEQEIHVEDEKGDKKSDEDKEVAEQEEKAEEEDRALNNASLEDIALTSFTKNQMEILELEMRARAIKSMLTAQMAYSAGDDDDDEYLESDDSDDSLIQATYKIYPPLTESPKPARQPTEKHSDSETEEGEVITDSEEELENNITVLSSKLDVPADVCMDSYHLLNDLSVKVAKLIEENIREYDKNGDDINVIASSLNSYTRPETGETQQQNRKEKALEDKNSIPLSHQEINANELSEDREASNQTCAVASDPVASKEETEFQSLHERESERKLQDTTFTLGKIASPIEQKDSPETVISEEMNTETATDVNAEEFKASDSPQSLDYNFDDEIDMIEVYSSDESESTEAEQVSEDTDDNEDIDGLEEEVRKSYRADMAEAARQCFNLDNNVQAELESNENYKFGEQLEENNEFIGKIVANEKLKEDDKMGNNLDLFGHTNESLLVNSGSQVVGKEDDINVISETMHTVTAYAILESSDAKNENLHKSNEIEVNLKAKDVDTSGSMSAEEDQTSRSSTSSKTESINETINETNR